MLSLFTWKKHIIISLFKKLIYETLNNFHQLTTHISTLTMWHNRFSKNENKAVGVTISLHRKPQHRDSKTKTSRHCDLDTTKATWHPKTETTKPRYRESKAIFQWTKSRGIEIPTLKNCGIEIPRPKSQNSDPYVPWYPGMVWDWCLITEKSSRTFSGRVD